MIFIDHKHYLNKRWVQKHGPEYAGGALGDYADHIADGWKIEYRLITLAKPAKKLTK